MLSHRTKRRFLGTVVWGSVLGCFVDCHPWDRCQDRGTGPGNVWDLFGKKRAQGSSKKETDHKRRVLIPIRGDTRYAGSLRHHPVVHHGIKGEDVFSQVLFLFVYQSVDRLIRFVCSLSLFINVYLQFVSLSHAVLIFAFVAQARNIQGTASHLPIRHLTNSPLPFSFVWEWVHPRLLL